MRHFRWLILVYGLGCASAYHLSDEAARYRSSLSEAKALDTVKHNVFPTAEQGGVCSAHTNAQFAHATPISLEGSKLVFESEYEALGGTRVAGNVGAGTGQVVLSHGTGVAKFELDLHEVNKIRVQSDVQGFGCAHAAGPALSGYVVMVTIPGVGNVSDGRPNAVMVHVSKHNLDHFVAALSALAPEARVLEGAGF